ncbi:hypothetical protein [Salibacterium lacus]|uniref:Uncharacterized protein n=1 Tax=Salibacterium lacus TaxID=1898109 RepID=A0ABW5T0V4_9BACI
MGYRRFVEYADETQVEDMYDILNLSYPGEEILEVNLPLALQRTIQTKYINFMKNNISVEHLDYISEYEESVWN